MGPTGFRLTHCRNDKQKQSVKIVILGLDPGIQTVFNFNTKDTKFLKEFCNKILRNAYDEIDYLDYHALARAFIMSSS